MRPLSDLLDLETRERYGRHETTIASSTMHRSLMGSSNNRRFRDTDIEHLYETVPDFRAPVDQVCRRVSTWPFGLFPTADFHTPEYLTQAAKIVKLAKFFRRPNDNGDTFEDIRYMTAMDLLLHDQAVWELNFGSVTGMVREIVPLKGSRIMPVVDNFGRILKYVESLGGEIDFVPSVDATGDSVEFSTRKIVTFRLSPRAGSWRRYPIPETLGLEILTLAAATQNMLQTLNVDEVPEGLFVFSGTDNGTTQNVLNQMRGSEGEVRNRLNAIWGPDAGTKGQWISTSHTYRELELAKNLAEIKYTVWRTYGVSRTEMGEPDANKASAQSHLEVGSNHMLKPILTNIASKINTRVLPGLDHGDIEFRFDLDARATAEEKLNLAKAFDLLIGRGVMTAEHVREEMGYDPWEEGQQPESDKDHEAANAEKAAANAANNDPNAAAPPGEAEDEAADDKKKTKKRTYDMHRRVAMSERADMPSEWQPDGVFSDVRTVDLVKLGESVAEYSAVVKPLWDEVARTIEDEIRNTGESASSIITRNLGLLGVSWDAATRGIYAEVIANAEASAVTIAASAGVKFPDTAMPSSVTHYGARAMDYLDTGLISEIENTARAKSVIVADRQDVADAVSKVMAGNRHRIENYSGKLVELASKATQHHLTSGEDEWWIQWQAVGGKGTCRTCESEGAQGFRLLSQMTITPGGETECGARCRCVWVYWLKSEIDNGTAVKL